MYWSPSPALIAWNAIRIVCSDDAQTRLTVTAGTWWSISGEQGRVAADVIALLVVREPAAHHDVVRLF